MTTLLEGVIPVRRSAFLGLPILLCAILALSGCGGGGGGDTAWTGIEGYVTVGRGDNALAGVTVQLHAVVEAADTYIDSSGTLTASVATNGAGYYKFAGLTAGTYKVEVQPTTGRPGARYQHLVVVTDQHLRADLVVPPAFPASGGNVLPYVRSLTLEGGLLQPGTVLSGTPELTVTAEAGAGGPPIKLMLVKIGNLSNGSNFTFDRGLTTESFTFDTTKMADGGTFIYVTTYDLNDNAASVMIPVTIDNNLTGSLPVAPEIVRVEAWTFAEPYGIKSAARRDFDLPPLKANVGGKSIYLPSADSLSAGSRALGGTGSAMVHIQIKPTCLGDQLSYLPAHWYGRVLRAHWGASQRQPVVRDGALSERRGVQRPLVQRSRSRARGGWGLLLPGQSGKRIRGCRFGLRLSCHDPAALHRGVEFPRQ